MNQPKLPLVERTVTRALDAGRIPGDTLASHVPGLARVVRDFQPGTEWAYSNAAAFDVLARVAEAASGLWASPEDYLAFAEFLREGRAADGRRLLSQRALAQLTANHTAGLCPVP